MSNARPAVFLDRDGTLILERHYLADPDLVRLLPGAGEALVRLRDAGFALILVTNQSGIARGLFREADFFAVQQRLDALLHAQGAHLDASYFCPHHPDHTGACECRKPGTLLFRRAIQEHGLAPDLSWYVGDRLSDLEPARTLGGNAILVRTGYGREHETDAGAFFVADDIADAADRILRTAKG